MKKINYEIISTSTFNTTSDLNDYLNFKGSQGFEIASSYPVTIQNTSESTSKMSIDIILKKETFGDFSFFKVGIYHNSGLNYLMQNSKVRPGQSIDEYFFSLLDTAKEFCIEQNILGKDDSTYSLLNCLIIANNSPEFLFNNPNVAWDKFIGINNLTPYAGDDWKEYLEQIKNVFETITPTDPVDVICKQIINQLDNLIYEFTNDGSMSDPFFNKFLENFRTPNAQLNNVGAELVGGVLYLCRASANYWMENYTKVGGGTTGGVGNFIQVDAFGYLFGWGSALWDDAHSPGGVQPSGQERRIGQGLLGAMAASGGLAFGPISQKILNSTLPSLVSDTTPFDTDEKFKQYFTL